MLSQRLIAGILTLTLLGQPWLAAGARVCECCCGEGDAPAQVSAAPAESDSRGCCSRHQAAPTTAQTNTKPAPSDDRDSGCQCADSCCTRTTSPFAPPAIVKLSADDRPTGDAIGERSSFPPDPALRGLKRPPRA